MTESEVNSLQRAGVIDHEKGKLFRLEDSAGKMIRHYRDGAAKDETVDYATERAKLMRAKRMGEEYELRLREGQLHEAADVEQAVGDMLLHFRARIMGVPAKLAPRLAKETDEKKIFTTLKAAMDDALNELSEYEGLFGAEDAEEDGEAL